MLEAIFLALNSAETTAEIPTEISAPASVIAPVIAPVIAGEKSEKSQIHLIEEISGTLIYFYRDRDRLNVADDSFHSNLDHQTFIRSVALKTPYFGSFIGFDFAVFGATDLYNYNSPDHEINFFPWRDPWSADYTKTKAQNGASIYAENIKLKLSAGEIEYWGKIGYFQPTGPGVLGVNWSFMPGTYKGAEAGINYGSLSIAAAYTNGYKAPWFANIYDFKKEDSATEIDYLYSIGAKYRFDRGIDIEAAYGESENYLQSAHIKLNYSQDDINLKYHIYLMGDRDQNGANDLYDGSTAYENYLAASYSPYPYTFKAEFLQTSAPESSADHAGYFAYRLISRYGGANGAYEAWWDLRSDFNHNGEKAVFVAASRDLDDLGARGVSAGLSAAYGWGGKNSAADEELRESAYAADISYLALDEGGLKARFNLHYTYYDNHTNIPSWTGYKNAFQDERDIKLLFTLSYDLNLH
ncbi:hypothetical protein AGMMS50229_04180 [Campylobacterota bacterium]|nr:hypothetical protein AGMMS50229_04180 [Campylobacterota bacterium]